MLSGRFRFEPEQHQYFDLETGDVIPSITQMLKSAGLVDDRFFTEDSSTRGTAVHSLCTEYDLGVLDDDDVVSCDSPYKGYLLAHACGMRMVQPLWAHVETPVVHRELRFAGVTVSGHGRNHSVAMLCTPGLPQLCRHLL